jgi:glycosyltransferase involved in cell wall biosynthesis
MPKLSIITINFNDKNGLKKTMESVISQSSTDFEYIVIDGGSTDGSKELIEKYQDKISYWVSELDKGIYHAMNKGILLAQGEYCQFLNSGDFLFDENVIAKMIEKTKDESILYGNMIKTLTNGKRLKNTSINTNSMLPFYLGSLNHSPSFIKKELFGKYGLYDESLKIVSDWKFFLKAIALGNESVKYLDIDVTVFDMTGISSTNSKLDKAERRQVLEELIPKSILSDYDLYWRDIEMMKRLKRYKLMYKFVWYLERILFKMEKRKM